ncbi:L,D-transpeptidase-like protein [Breoghania corrubedonensis]|uniref:L,D-transpeptidase-like protein n=1 Tax=Breoghania corrubedonensis TaxID=665038 RepID=A0A2T5V9N6_9HYPH|nr:L,D-transpeptidase [Breoghania corrubedonensis]PTW60465.1 L,D-transpeptidase-like protein [Breoghania corrubedonensis]
MFRKLILSMWLFIGFTATADATANAGLAYDGPSIVAVVDLSDQQLSIYNAGVLLHQWKVSTARRGYITPVGRYRPYRIHKMWRSRKYDNAPMPYSVFFHKGWAVHGTNAIRRLGRPASHGCVRLDPKNAKMLYGLVRQYGMEDVEIVIRK